MSKDRKNSLFLGVDPAVVFALMSVYLAGQRAADGHMPQLRTSNGLRISVEPASNVVTLVYRDLIDCDLTAAQAYELATMMTAAADALRQLNETDVSSVAYDAVSASLSRLKSAEASSS